MKTLTAFWNFWMKIPTKMTQWCWRKRKDLSEVTTYSVKISLMRTWLIVKIFQIKYDFSQIFLSLWIGLLRQWQDMLHLIVKQLQLSETLNKIIGDIKRLEEEVGKVLMGRPPPPVMHNKSDLEKDIDGLKVSKLKLDIHLQKKF